MGKPTTTSPPAESMSVSIVIPVLGDGDALAVLLPRLEAMIQPGDSILVVDGEADENCRSLCAGRGHGYLASAPGRGRQLHAGAGQAGGPVLWFLHLRGGRVGGYFRFRFSGQPGWHKSALAFTINLRNRVGVPYGDQGLFATRAAYLAAGGFPDQPLFEEVPLVHGLRRQGRFTPLPATLGVSPRRWERDGWLRRTLANRLLALGYLLGVPPRRLALWYHGNGAAAARASQHSGGPA